MRWMLLILLATGCVGRNKHELLQIRLEATQTAMSAREASCREATTAADARIADLEEAHELDRMHIDGLAEQVIALQGSLEGSMLSRAELARSIPVCPEPEPVEEPDGEPVEEPVQAPDTEPGEAPVAEPEPLFPEPIEAIADALAVLDDQQHAEARLSGWQADVDEAFAPLVDGGWAQVLPTERGAIVVLPVAKLFVEERVIASPRGQTILDDAAAALKALPGTTVEVAGHTDDTPHHSVDHPSNWELGFHRAMSVLRNLEDRGMRNTAHASSFAGLDPLVPNDDDTGRKTNNRVELRLTPPPPPEVEADAG